MQQLERVQAGAKMTALVIQGTKLQVPSSLKVTIQRTVKQHPELARILIVILKKFKPPKLPPGKPAKLNPKPKPGKPGIRRPIPPKIRPEKTPKPKGPPKKHVNIPSGGATLNVTLPIVKPAFPVYEVTQQLFLAPDLEGMSDRVRFWLELLINQPNYFPVIYGMLTELGVKFPDVRGPIESVVLGNGKNVKLPHTLTMKYSVTINGKSFTLPKDSNKLAIYITKHPEKVAVIVNYLGHLGATFSVDKKGMISSFRLFNVTYKLPKPVGTQLPLRGRTYVLPRDMKLVIDALKDKPQDFLKIQVLIDAFGAKLKKGPGNSIQAMYNNKTTGTIKMPKNVRIKIKDKSFDIPADLKTILRQRQDVPIGELLAALQRAKILVKVDEATAVVRAIVIDKVEVPFPLTIDLRFKLENNVYNIPRDLKKLIAYLEAKGMPSKVLHILYTRYGVIPVRNAAGIVIALSFNGVEYKVKAEKPTTVAFLGQKFLLPKESQKMVDFVNSKGRPAIKPFLKALQVAGYMFIPESNGLLSSIQKGAQIISLGMKIRISVVFQEVNYRMPFDLPRLVKKIKGLSAAQKQKIMKQLDEFGVTVTKKGKKLVIVFNSVKYEVDD
ncbi:hypothetical protein V5799_020661 [Amblyomma americanum]|uniref:Immunoglobulin G binding protein A n=1 Tax=Amblyomma americanum TaxID=6943 RepID=A0AAQ4ETB3_AMBAM